MKNHYARKGLICLLGIVLPLLSFSVPVKAGINYWSDIGQVSTNPYGVASFDDNGTLYVVTSDYGDGYQLTVKKYDGSSWSLVGPERFTSNISDDAVDPTIFVENGIPYVAFIDDVDAITGITVMKYVDGSWQLLGPQLIPLDPVDRYEHIGNTVSLFVDNGTPYIALVHNEYYSADGIVNKVSVMKFNGISWQFVGAPRFSDAYVAESCAPSLFVSDHIPYVAYCERNETFSPELLRVKRFDSLPGSWVDVGSIPADIQTSYGEMPTIKIAADNIFVSIIDDGYAKVFKYAAGTWSILGNNEMNDGYANQVAMTLFRGEPVVAIDDSAFGNSNYVTVEKVDASGNWVAIGGNAAPVWPYYISSDEHTFSLVSDQNSLYLSCKFSGFNNYFAHVFNYGVQAAATVNIQVNQNAGGSYTRNTTTYTDAVKTFSVPAGSDLDLVFNADTGYIIQSVTVDDILVATKPGLTWTYSGDDLTVGHTIAVTYAQGYQVTMSIPNGNGTYSGSGLNASTLIGYYLNSETTSLTAVPDTGYVLTYWWQTGNPTVVSNVNPIPINSGTAHELTARFDPYYTYTSSANEGGTITPTRIVYATWDPATPADLYYPAVTFTITPDSGYHILTMMVDGYVVDPTPTYLFPSSPMTAPPGNHSITVSFAVDENVSDVEEEVADLITFFKDEITAGNLVGLGIKGKNDPNRLNAFGNILEVVQQKIALGDYEGALLQLRSAYTKVDGKPIPPDFISGASRQVLADKIMELIEMLEDLI